MVKDVKPAPRELMNPYEKPPSMSTSQSLKMFMYNPETGAVMGRTASSWGKIGLFYLIFYGVLAALVAICFWVFFQTLDPRRPTWQLEQSIIGTNPGLGFRPMPPKENVESTLIWYKATDRKNWEHWVESLKEFLEIYRKPGLLPGGGANIHNCDFDSPPGHGQVCNVNVDNWRPCHYENNFGFDKSSPCIFLKLNRIFGWTPEYYNDTSDLPHKMPQYLKNHIKSLTNPLHRNTVWVSCEGENPADQEYIGKVKVIAPGYPGEYQYGFPGYYFPYENSEGYRSPLVAVYFERPQPNVLINVECKAWAKNIIHNRNDKLGSVHFELLID